MDHQMPDDANAANHQQYQFYPSTDNDQYNNMQYNPAIPYPPMGHPTRIVPEMPYANLTTIGISQHHYPPSFSPPHGSSITSTTPPPASPELYEAMSPPLSGSDTSGDGIYHHSNSSGANSPSSSRPHSLVQRSARYNPTPSPTRRRGRSQDSDDEDMGTAPMFDSMNLAHTRKEATRRQRIEAEQRRRDELRDGYAKLKDALPVSNQKSSKVSLLERATNHIIALEKENQELQQRITFLEGESTRLRSLNEKISLSSDGGTPGPDGMRQATPEAGLQTTVPTHSLTAVHGQQPPSEHSSPSASEGGH